MTNRPSTVTGTDRGPVTLLSVLWGRPFPFAAGEDPDAAPGARPRTDGVRRFTVRRARQNGVWMFVAGLVFLVFFYVPLLAAPLAGGQVAVAAGLGVVVALGYVATALAADLPLVGRIAYVAAFVAVVCGGLAPFIGSYVISMAAYVGIMTAHLLPWRLSRLGLPIGALVGVGVGIASGNWIAIAGAVFGGGMGLFLAMGMENRRFERRLDRAEQRIATLAVAAERERIARDLHDILGHSLTAVVVKAGLAARLSAAAPDAAREQMIEVEQIARQALADVRATASGFHQVRLASEIASARSVLQAAGITSVVPPALDPMPDEVSELFGYVVREGVTNVIRHAGATACTITASSTRVSVTDDGVGLARARAGSGLTGLRARAELIGAVITTTPLDGAGGTTLRVDLDPRMVGSTA